MTVDRALLASLEAKPGKGDELNGQIPAALGQPDPDLLAGDPDIRTADVHAVK